MSTAVSFILLVLSKYLVPTLFVIGLVYFVYGVIEYFIVGKGGDEERAQHGRELLLKSITWLVLAIVAHLVVVLFAWLGSLPTSGVNGLNRPTPQGDGVENNEAILRVPNAPNRR